MAEPHGAYRYREGCWFAAVKPLLISAAAIRVARLFLAQRRATS